VKKLIAILTTMVFALAMFTVPVLAGVAPRDIEVKPEYRTVVSGPTTYTMETSIPIYGYVGPDALITDPDPDSKDPDKPPIVSLDAISVSVPVKLIWAAFEGNTQVPKPTPPVDIESANYYIKNIHATNRVKVTLVDVTAKNFTPQPTPAQNDYDAVNPWLKLDLEFIGTASTMQKQHLVISTYPDATTAGTWAYLGQVSNPGNIVLGIMNPGVEWPFKLSGSWGGTFPVGAAPTPPATETGPATPYRVAYNMNLKFELDPMPTP
jgi:hypothetical protein